MKAQDPVQIVEVAPRDGFQAVKRFIPTPTKIAVVEALMEAKYRRLEVGAFVSPKAIPQMADTAKIHAVFAAKSPSRAICLSTLVPNAIGGQMALDAGVRDLVFVLSASESHNQSNVRRTIAESQEELEIIVAAGRQLDGFKLRVNIATVFDCPYEGRTPEKAVLDIIEHTLEMDIPVEFGLCDTTGRGFPDHVATLCDELVDQHKFDTSVAWAFHGHDTYGLGVANALFAYEAGIRVFDAAAAGLGGCPFAPGASGNTASEDLVFTFENMGISTGVDLNKLLDATALIDALPDIDTGGHVRLLPRLRISA